MEITKFARLKTNERGQTKTRNVTDQDEDQLLHPSREECQPAVADESADRPTDANPVR